MVSIPESVDQEVVDQQGKPNNKFYYHDVFVTRHPFSDMEALTRWKGQ
jgi:hypothetical protein